MPILKNAKHERFAQNLAVKMMKPIDALMDAGYKAGNRTNASKMASSVSAIPAVRARLEELMTKHLDEAEKTSVSSLHSDAIRKMQELLNSDNPQVAAKMVAEILSRSDPVVRQSQNVTVNISSKDREKRIAILEAKRATMITAKDITKEIAK